MSRAYGPALRCLLAIGLLFVASCSDSTTGSPSPRSSPGRSAGVSIPAGGLPPDIQCYVDHGFTLVKVSEPGPGSDRAGYQLETDLQGAQFLAVKELCDKLAPPDVPKTDAELRTIYDRWVTERECLVQLGYQPAPPPSLEKFVSDWRSGPWMPIDGVDTGSWTDAQYREAKERCTLEFFDRA